MTPRPTHHITVKESWLSDGSAVYDVELTECPPQYTLQIHEDPTRLVFNAVDRGAAYRLAEKIAALLNDTNLCLAIAEVRDHTYA